MPTDQPTDDEPDTADDAGGADPADAFAALADPVRVDILEALAAHNREEGHREPVGFADLRRRVGVRDSGRFRYHLNELCDRFVTKTDEGYRLTHVGMEMVAAVLAGTYTEDPSLGPAELDSDCPRCDAAALAAYEQGYCRVACENDHLLFGWRLPPSAAAGADLQVVVERAELFARQAIERNLAGLCPYCHADVSPSLVLVDADGDRSLPVDGEAGTDPDPDAEADRVTDANATADGDAEAGRASASAAADRSGAVRFRTTCDTCGAWLDGPVGFCLLVDPEIAAFYRCHGRALEKSHLWEPAFVREDSAVTVVEEDPLRVEATARLEEDVLTATVDERGRVVSVATDTERN